MVLFVLSALQFIATARGHWSSKCHVIHHAMCWCYSWHFLQPLLKPNWQTEGMHQNQQADMMIVGTLEAHVHAHTTTLIFIEDEFIFNTSVVKWRYPPTLSLVPVTRSGCPFTRMIPVSNHCSLFKGLATIDFNLSQREINDKIALSTIPQLTKCKHNIINYTELTPRLLKGSLLESDHLSFCHSNWILLHVNACCSVAAIWWMPSSFIQILWNY